MILDPRDVSRRTWRQYRIDPDIRVKMRWEFFQLQIARKMRAEMKKREDQRWEEWERFGL